MKSHLFSRMRYTPLVLVLAGLSGCTTIDQGPTAPPPPAPSATVSAGPVAPTPPPSVPIPQKAVEPGKSALDHTQADQPLYKRP